MIQNNILVSNNNSDSNSLRFFSSLCETNSILQPSWGTGPATFSRASAQYITDFEGIVRKVESGCPAVEGSRVVTNLLKYSEDLSNSVWGKLTCTAESSTVTVTSLLDYHLRQNLTPRFASRTVQVRVTFEAKRISGTGNLLVDVCDSWKTRVLTTEWRRYSVDFFSDTFKDHGFDFVDFAFTTTGTYGLRNIQLEIVTGQTNTNPGEYVKTTSAAVTKCFSTTNGNTVDANGIVTEATGTALPQSYPERANSTAYALNDKIQVAGWWYYCTTAGTSASSAPTFPTGKAGSQTVTDGTAVWTIGGRLLLGYVSEPASTNKVTAYGIIPADTLGSELITVAADREFSSDTGAWTREAGFTIEGDMLNTSSAPSGSSAFINLGLVMGRPYQVTYTVTTLSAGAFRPQIGGVFGTTRSTTGTFTDIIVGTGEPDPYLYMRAVGTTTGSIDNISVKEAQWAVGTKSFHNGSSFVQNITGLTLAGDTAAMLSIVTDQTEIEKAGLAGINPSYKVYKLDNSWGSGTATVEVSGTTGNTNAHSISVTARKQAGSGSSVLQLLSGTGATAIAGSVYSKIVSANLTPSGTTQTLNVVAGIGDTLYFLLPQLEELPYATSVMPTAGATATRAATSLSYPTAGNLRGNDVTVGVEWTPANSYTGTRGLLHSYSDANNAITAYYDTGALVSMVKKLSGSYYTTSTTVPLVQDRTYKQAARLSSAGVDGFYAGVKNTTRSSNSITALIGASLVVGSRTGGSFNVGTYLRNLKIWFKPLNDDRCKQLTL